VTDTTINVWNFAHRCDDKKVVEFIGRAAAHAMNIPAHAGTKPQLFPAG
jgi:hypothetical protein